MVTDTGGIDDRSFNASAWKGLQDAHAADQSIEIHYLQSGSESDYVPNINAFINQKCDLIVTVGFLMGDQTQSAAKQHPDQHFAIVDYGYKKPLKNVRALLYNTAQDAFLGGYLAAGLTKTGVVATYGGQKLPTVTIYMDGFYDGVQYYNKTQHKNVKVLGWNEKSQQGSFTGDFTDQAKGKSLTETFMQQDADIIFPVAGNVGLGSVAAVKASGNDKTHLLWVDVDGCVSAPQDCQYFYASVTKGIAHSVKSIAQDAKAGNFQGGNYVGTLQNKGVALDYGKKLGSQIPQSLKKQVATVKTKIENGSIKVESPSQPGG